MVSIDRTQLGKYPETQQFKAWADLIGTEAALTLGCFSKDGASPVILGGLLLVQGTGGATTWQLTQGAIAWDGGIYYSAGGDTGIANSQPLSYVQAHICLTPSITGKTIEVASGGIAMENGSNPIIVTYGQLNFGTSGTFVYNTIQNIWSLNNGIWLLAGTDFNFTSAWSNPFSFSNVRARINKDKSVKLCGVMENATSYTPNTNSLAFTLPITMATAKYFVVGDVSTPGQFARIIIDASGNVSVYSSSSGGFALCLDSIPIFYLD